MFPKRKLLRKRYYKLAVTLFVSHCERSEAIPELTLSCWGKKVRLLRKRIYDLAVTKKRTKRRPRSDMPGSRRKLFSVPARNPLLCHCEDLFFVTARSEATKQSHEIASPNEKNEARNDRGKDETTSSQAKKRTTRRPRRDPLCVVARGAAPKQPRSSGVLFETALEAKLRPGMTEEKG